MDRGGDVVSRVGWEAVGSIPAISQLFLCDPTNIRLLAYLGKAE